MGITFSCRHGSCRDIHANGILPFYHRETMDSYSSSEMPIDRIARRAARLRTLLQLGGSMENNGSSLHVAGYRMDVGNISDMDEAVWGQVQRNIREVLDPFGTKDN